MEVLFPAPEGWWLLLRTARLLLQDRWALVSPDRAPNHNALSLFSRMHGPGTGTWASPAEANAKALYRRVWQEGDSLVSHPWALTMLTREPGPSCTHIQQTAHWSTTPGPGTGPRAGSAPLLCTRIPEAIPTAPFALPTSSLWMGDRTTVGMFAMKNNDTKGKDSIPTCRRLRDGSLPSTLHLQASLRD